VPGGHDDIANAVAGATALAAQAAAHPPPKIVSPAFYSRQMGWIGTGAANTAGKSATQLFYENGGYGGGSYWPGSGPREW
jgi:opacity protein-like surface antigen